MPVEERCGAIEVIRLMDFTRQMIKLNKNRVLDFLTQQLMASTTHNLVHSLIFTLAIVCVVLM